MDRWVVVRGQGAFSAHPNEQAMDPRPAGLRLYNGDDRTDCEDGVLTLTSHRLVWEDRERPRWLYLPLYLISHTEFVERSFTRSAKIKLLLYENPAPPTPAHYSTPGMKPRHHVLLSFRQSGSSDVKAFRHHLHNVMQAKTWQALPVPLAPEQPHQPRQRHAQPGTAHQSAGLTAHKQQQQQKAESHRVVGIAGILQRDKQRLEEADKSIRDAFGGDLKDLQAKAKQLVQLAETYTKTLAATEEEESGATTDEDQRALQNVILQLGIANPITKKQFKSSSRYHEELARELATVFEAALKATRGMMLLADAFCVANRVRGIDLVSPQDVLKACEAMSSLGLPVRLRRFESGVLVLELANLSEEELVQELKQCAEKQGFLTASRLATHNNISAVLAAEQLLLAERSGALCRDDAVEGLRFYPNRFLQNTGGA